MLLTRHWCPVSYLECIPLSTVRGYVGALVRFKESFPSLSRILISTNLLYISEHPTEVCVPYILRRWKHLEGTSLGESPAPAAAKRGSPWMLPLPGGAVFWQKPNAVHGGNGFQGMSSTAMALSIPAPSVILTVGQRKEWKQVARAPRGPELCGSEAVDFWRKNFTPQVGQMRGLFFPDNLDLSTLLNDVNGDL